MSSCLGRVTLTQRQSKKLGLRAKSQLSPGLETCGLRLCAQASYEQAEENLRTVMGVRVGHSSLHRLVQRVGLPSAQATGPVEALSVDGGKVRLRLTPTGPGEWRDYKAVSLHGSVCAAFFQAPHALQAWSEQQPLSPMVTCVGDGHPGIWKVLDTFGGPQIAVRREVLDWYHLMENLYKVGGSLQRLARVKTLLWVGQVEAAIAEFEGSHRPQARRFMEYLQTHRQRLPHYAHYQRLGLPIGSGSVESKIKQMAARLKLAGASWKPDSVPQMLRLRCAFLNNDPTLSASA